jgi:hypothetical protein
MMRALGITLIGVGALGLIVVHSFRPPEGILDAIGLLASGRQQFIRPPLYQLLLAFSALVTVSGLYLALSRRNDS